MCEVTPTMKSTLTRIAREENLHTSLALVRSALVDFVQKRQVKVNRFNLTAPEIDLLPDIIGLKAQGKGRGPFEPRPFPDHRNL